MAKACTGHNGQTQKKRWKEMCSQSSCASPVSLGLPCDFPWDFFVCLGFF